jgi:hypothetical protein
MGDSQGLQNKQINQYHKNLVAEVQHNAINVALYGTAR